MANLSNLSNCILEGPQGFGERFLAFDNVKLVKFVKSAHPVPMNFSDSGPSVFGVPISKFRPSIPKIDRFDKLDKACQTSSSKTRKDKFDTLNSGQGGARKFRALARVSDASACRRELCPGATGVHKVFQIDFVFEIFKA